MRIAMVSAEASPLVEPAGRAGGGQSAYVRDLGEALADAGHDVTVVTRRTDPALPASVALRDGLVVRHLCAGPQRRLPRQQVVAHVPAFARECERLWRRSPPDVVHAHFWMSGLATAAAARDLGLPFVVSFHSLGHVARRTDGEGPVGRAAAEQVIAHRADRCLARSGEEALELGGLGVPRDRVALVPGGVDTDVFAPAGPAARRGPRPRLLALGRLDRSRGVDELVEALRLVPRVELVVAGGPPRGSDHGTDADLVRLRRLAAAVGVPDRVRFVGAVPRRDVPALLRSAAVVVRAPWHDSVGTGALEAMSCARPVVASAVGGLRDMIVDGVTGVLVRPRRVGDLAGALRALLGESTMPVAFGVAGRDRALSRYRWSRVAAEVEQTYRAAVRRHGVATSLRRPG